MSVLCPAHTCVHELPSLLGVCITGLSPGEGRVVEASHPSPDRIGLSLRPRRVGTVSRVCSFPLGSCPSASRDVPL